VEDFIRDLGDIRIENLGLDYGVLADTIEVVAAVLLMLGGIYLTYLVQKWADKAGEIPPAANVGLGGGPKTHEERGLRE
jgi:threonine/homoserine/homoserine lactone efflux protein